MTWTIDNQSHPDKAIAEFIEYIFIRVADFFYTTLGKPPLGIKSFLLKHDPIEGPIIYWPLKIDCYEIGVDIEGRYPYQAVYQLAHELCHIYIDPRISGVFIEIVCHKTAFDVLEDISASLPDINQEGIRNYIQNEKLKSEKEKSMTLTEIDLKWIRQIVKRSEATDTLYDRKMNNLIALKLKDTVDSVYKYGLISQIKSSIDFVVSTDINNLNTNGSTKVNFPLLLQNISSTNPALAKVLKDLD